jgi:cation-transporting ATPase E
MKDFLVILRRNVLSPIVIAILVLASTLLVLGERRDAWFISVVIIVNTVLAIVQEVRAQQALKKLELMSAPRARRLLTGDELEEVMYDQLQLGDTIRIQAGDEIPADAELLINHGLEVDEGLLTGESTPIDKQRGQPLYAGSVAMAGAATAKVTAVGASTKAGTMTATLKSYTPQLTPLQQAINRAITYLTYGALALAVVIFVAYHATGQDAVRIFKTITAAAVTIVPEGLLLASSLLLAFGSLKLAQARVLPQKLAAIEAMALLSVLCVDKTGTLTSNTITFDSFVPPQSFNAREIERLRTLIGILARETGSDNPTGQAVMQALGATTPYKVVATLAFSSARKLSGVRVEYDGATTTLLMGAPEYIAEYAPLTEEDGHLIRQAALDGKRVLAVAVIDDNETALKQLTPGSGQLGGLVFLTNPLREGVTDTVAYLQGAGVSLRVISGDSPDTVRYVAAAAGIVAVDRVITGAELALLDDVAWRDAVTTTTIFARVLPEQKERIITTLMADGQFTGMVGDGVNDALALKRADLGVAMYAGAAASRRVADIVLLDNSFTSLPLGMKLGNRIMQAIELIAALFFHKIIFGVTLLLATLALGEVYPFAPRHVTFMNIFLVTLPTVMWAFFPPRPQHRINPQLFWHDTLRPVIPIGLISGGVVTVFYWAASLIRPHDRVGVVTSTVLIATFFGIWMVFLSSRMLGVVYDHVTRLARAAYLVAVVIVAFVSFGTGLLRDFFDFSRPSWSFLWPAALLVTAAAMLQYQVARRAGNRLRNRQANK